MTNEINSKDDKTYFSHLISNLFKNNQWFKAK